MATPRPFNAPTTFKPQISPQGEVARQVARMEALNPKPTTTAWNPLSWFKGKAAGATKAVQSAPGAVKGAVGAAKGAVGTAAAPTAAAGTGLAISGAIVQSAGTPGAARMSLFGLGPTGKGSDAPVYNTPFNNNNRPKESGTKITIDGKVYDTGYHSKEIAELRKKNPGGGNAAQSTTTFTPSVTPTNRSTPAPDGGSGKGVQTSPRQMTMDEANSLLTGGYKVVNPFSNTQLPDTSGSPYFGKGNTPDYRSDAPADFYDGELASDLTTGSPFKQGDYTYEVPTNTNIEYLQTSGAPLIQTGGAVQASETTSEAEKQKYAKPPKRPRGERAGEMWDRKYGRMNQQPEPTESKGSGIDYKRRAAFLDAPNSLQGLRRVEAQKGIVVAGGTYNMVNPNRGQEGENDFIKISKEDRDSYMRGDQGAQDLKAKYVAKVSESADKPADTFTSPPNYTMTPGVDVKTAESQRPAIEVDTSKLSEPVEYESPGVKFKGGRDKYKK